MKPQNGYLIAEVLKPEEAKTAGGLLLPEITQVDKVFSYGKVLFSNDEYQVGETVLYNRYTPYDFEYEGKVCVAIKATDIIAII